MENKIAKASGAFGALYRPVFQDSSLTQKRSISCYESGSVAVLG